MRNGRARSRAEAVQARASGDLAREQQTMEGGGALSNTVFGLLTQATTAIFTAALTVYLARALGEARYGEFALALSVSGIAVLASDAGVSHSVARFIAERHTDRDAMADVAAAALVMNLVASISVGVLVWVLASPIASGFGQSSLTWPLRGIAIAVVGQGMLLLYLRIFAGARRVRLGVGATFVESLVETGASIALVAVGGGVTGAAFGRAIGYGVGAAAAMITCRRLLGGRAFSLRRRGDTRIRDIARYTGPLLITNSAWTLYASIDSLLIAGIISTSAVGLFAGPMRLLLLLSYPGQAVAGALGPRVARSADQEPDAATWNAGVRWLLMFQFLLVAPLLVWPQPIIELLLGNGFHAAGGVLRTLTLYAFLGGLGPVMAISVNYLGAGAKRIPIVLVTLVVNVVLDVMLLPLIGVIGAAIGTSVAYAIYVPAHFRLCRQSFAIPLRPLARTAARAAVSAAVMAAVLFAVGTSHLSVAQWVGGLAGGTIAFLLALVLTGEVRPAELRGLVVLLRARTAAA